MEDLTPSAIDDDFELGEHAVEDWERTTADAQAARFEEPSDAQPPADGVAS